MNGIKVMGLCAMILGVSGCVEALKDEDPGCACTAEYRYNICVTWDGSDRLPEALTFFRELQSGVRDTLPSGFNCFGELRMPQRILVQNHSDLLDTSVIVDSSAWFTPATVDCCHGEAKTIAFVK